MALFFQHFQVGGSPRHIVLPSLAWSICVSTSACACYSCALRATPTEPEHAHQSMAVAGRAIGPGDFEAETATGLSAMVGEGVNHGSVTRFLSGKDDTAKGHGRQHGQAGRECRCRADLWRSHSGKGMYTRERIDLLAWRPL